MTDIIDLKDAHTYKVSTLMRMYSITKEQARALKDTGCVEIKKPATTKKAKAVK